MEEGPAEIEELDQLDKNDKENENKVMIFQMGII